MTLIELLIIIIPIVVILTVTTRFFFKANEEGILYVTFLFCLLILSVIAISSTAGYLERKKGMKCPEYEKVENVYRLKE